MVRMPTSKESPVQIDSISTPAAGLGLLMRAAARWSAFPAAMSI